ncbi:uncharacterized protein LOC121373666 [Gigantopelta aegis]|uniref:uncharacterized protein LOC121373666 n=1 Tax=Gigantopelta aegis TaxID=1735272 RepID=UPI001B88C0CC|nr:uncharacterized protein LOC121373666 [Gigantopelta aegis]
MLVRVLYVLWLAEVVSPHGHLKSPASRSSMWRYGWETAKNYDDNQLFCGGREHLWEKMKGKCGICGDAYDDSPRPNEWPGEYAKGIVTESYTAGDVITVQVDVTANHGGYFEFRLCPLKSYMMEATQACLDRLLLEQPDGSRKYHVDQKLRAQVFSVRLRLPKSVTCDRCVMQWKWNTANSWGCMENHGSGNKKCCVGCGQQEQFVNCADVSITRYSGSARKRLPSTPIARVDDIPYKGWKPTAVFAGPPKNIKKPPVLEPQIPVPKWISVRTPVRPSSRAKQPFQFDPIPPSEQPFFRTQQRFQFNPMPSIQTQQPFQFNPMFPEERPSFRTQQTFQFNPPPPAEGPPVLPSNQGASPFSRFIAGSNIEKGFVVGIPNSGFRPIIANPRSGPQPSFLVPRSRSRSRGFFVPSLSQETRWNPGESFVVSHVQHSSPSKMSSLLLHQNTRARCVPRFPKFTTFSCREKCSPKQQTCVSKSVRQDPESACSWMCTVG